MLSLSDALSSTTVKRYHREVLTPAEHSYFSEAKTVLGEWHGKMVPYFGLEGANVSQEAFDRLADGQHPQTGEQLVKWVKPVKDPEWVLDQAAWAERIKGHYSEYLRTTGEQIPMVFGGADLEQKKRGFQKNLPVPQYDDLQRKLIEIHEDAARFFSAALISDKGTEAREYIEGARKVSPEIVAEFRLGFAPQDWSLEREFEQKYGRDLMVKSGLFRVTDNGVLRSRFLGRVMIPIQDTAGNVIAFAGRTLRKDLRWKYLNSPETAIYKKSEVLFNAHRSHKLAAESGQVAIVEGYFDAIAGHSAGVATVATSGTAFTEAHGKIVGTIATVPVLNMDSDKAGLAAGKKVVRQMLASGTVPRIVILGEKDAAKLVEENGADAYRREIEKSKSVVSGLSLIVASEITIKKNGVPIDIFDRIDANNEIREILGAADKHARVEIDQHLSAFLEQKVETPPKERAAHRAGWDMTFNAPKSVSLTALVAGDERIIRWHDESVREALDAYQAYIQARMGGNSKPAATGKWIVAMFRHDTSRPVDGFPDAHLHTHCVLFNMTEGPGGKVRSIESYELFRAQTFAKAVYQCGMEYRIRTGGYQIEYGENYAPEIAGYTREYIEASSKRHALIQAKAQELGVVGHEAESIIQHQFREGKLKIRPEELKAMHAEEAARYGDQPHKIMMEALDRKEQVIPTAVTERAANAGVSFARRDTEEREAVFDGWQILRDAMYYARGDAKIEHVRQAMKAQIEKGQFIPVHHVRPNAPGKRYTTPRAQQIERNQITQMIEGANKAEPIKVDAAEVAKRFPKLNDGQFKCLVEVLHSTDQIHGIQGRAGTGKSWMMGAYRELVQERGYKIHGLGATSQAAAGLSKPECGIQSETVAAYLQRGGVKRDAESEKPRIIVIDEVSQVSARALWEISKTLRPQDRMIPVGDIRQHNSVEAGRIFEELQQAGMRYSTVDQIVRQKEESLREIVTDLSQGRMNDAVAKLHATDRVHEVKHRDKRFAAAASDFVANPDGAVVVVSDNNAREAMSAAVRKGLEEKGSLGADKISDYVLVPRQNVTGAGRTFVRNYKPGDVLFCREGSDVFDIPKRSYATVKSTSLYENLLTVELENGKAVTYNPERYYGVSIYEKKEISLAVGERIQFTAKTKGILTRDLATVTYADEDGNIRATLDRNGKTIAWNVKRNRHFDYGYAMTSHAIQGDTKYRAIIHIEADNSRVRHLVNETFMYVAVSRGVWDVTVYVDNAARMPKVLARACRNTVALPPEEIKQHRKVAVEKQRKIEPEIERKEAVSHGYAIGA